jgi:hypothetical protein
VFAHRCDWNERIVVAVHNLSAEPTVVRVELGDVPGEPKLDDLLDERPAIDTIEGSSIELKLERYGYRWFRIMQPDQRTPP